MNNSTTETQNHQPETQPEPPVLRTWHALAFDALGDLMLLHALGLDILCDGDYLARAAYIEARLA